VVALVHWQTPIYRQNLAMPSTSNTVNIQVQMELAEEIFSFALGELTVEAFETKLPDPGSNERKNV
jgi:hypothetical protein